ncbi:hypothetical protein [Epilithonimonas caeni]|uniref:hypothetical protein n=1 Tax=Epilithonimonas caeni TaxID=365343 RepID=UPI0012EC76B4|nr:hypothetical protein [Epilithonimonas caeni]
MTRRRSAEIVVALNCLTGQPCHGRTILKGNNACVWNTKEGDIQFVGISDMIPDEEG